MRSILPLVLALLAAPATAAAQVPPQPPATARAAADSSPRSQPDSIRRRQRAPRRIPVTSALLASAFSDTRARPLLLRARAARVAQDSALQSYEAKTYQRLSLGVGFRRIGRDRLFMRSEAAANVRWQRGVGVWVEPTGRRAVFPALKEAQGEADLLGTTPIPYYPGRESLWIPSSGFGMVQAEVDDREMVHPLAEGAEAYYKYATGDSVSIRLPQGRTIPLRELRITARRPDWRLFVGSFWFDTESGQLVRAAYRMSVDMDIWNVASEETKRELEEALARDTSAAAQRRARASAEDDEPPAWVTAMMNPMKANVSSITVEYGLHDGRFWMPKVNSAEGSVQAGFIRMPLRIEESFRYASVNGGTVVPPLPPARTAGDTASSEDIPSESSITMSIGGNARAQDTTAAARAARNDSLVQRYRTLRDSLTRVADSLRTAGDTARARAVRTRAQVYTQRANTVLRRAQECVTDSTYFAGVRTRYDGALRIAVRMPCDTMKLANSPDLPGSIYDSGEQLFGAAERDALLDALDMSLQPEWGPQPPVLHSGLDLVRYNRIEGLSVGGTVTQALGLGYTARLLGRIGVADLVPNGELSLARSNGRSTLRAAVFHRLGVANDDWGSPLSFGASLASLLYARDEGFYYRTWGAEVSNAVEVARLGSSLVTWRLFAEQQYSASREPETQFSLGRVVGSSRFIDNIEARRGFVGGLGVSIQRSFGSDPVGLRLTTMARAEGAAGDFDYARGSLEATISRGLGPVAAALTGSAGTSGGSLPIQRAFFVGGLQTVRGQFASPTAPGQVGNAFWLARAELGTNVVAVRPVVFYDVGWAGSRDRFSAPGRPLSGAGVGLSFLDGLVRTDLSRGIYPQKKLRFDMYVEARF